MVGRRMEAGMRNFYLSDYRGVSETWNVIQHEASVLLPYTPAHIPLLPSWSAVAPRATLTG